jgi:uncharacterized protein YajQ (UPF0234 family)
MNDIDLLNAIEELSKELFRRYGVNGKEVTLTITDTKAIVKDSHGNTVEEISYEA